MGAADFDFGKAFGDGVSPAPEGVHPYAWHQVLEGREVAGIFGREELGIVLALSERRAVCAYADGDLMFDATDDRPDAAPQMRLRFRAPGGRPAPLTLTFTLAEALQRDLWYRIGSHDALPVAYVDVSEALVLGRKMIDVTALRVRIATTLDRAERGA